jgi:hypothetical protein
MPNTTRWYEIAGNFSPHFTRMYLFFRQFPNCRRNTRTRIMRSKISGNFLPPRCITNDNSIILYVPFSNIFIFNFQGNAEY